jgi:hypothetical protein
LTEKLTYGITMNLRSRGLSYLANYPKNELYRLVVDGILHKQECGWVAYEEREPGCLRAAFQGLTLAISNLEETHLTRDFIRQLHAACTKSVANISNNIGGKFRQRLIEDIVGIVLYKDTVSEEGIGEILNHIEMQTDYSQYHSAWLGPFRTVGDMIFEDAIYNTSIQKIREENNVTSNEALAKKIFPSAQREEYGYLAPRAGIVFNKKIDKLIESYNTKIITAKTEDDKLEIIVELITEFERLHPFFDANIRVFAILLLNRLLLQNGFPPATLENPNRFDAYSKPQLVVEVKKGIRNSIELIHGKKDLFDFNSETIPSHRKNELDSFTHTLRMYLKDKADELKKLEEADKLTRGYSYLPKKNVSHKVLLFDIAKQEIQSGFNWYLEHNKKVAVAVDFETTHLKDNKDDDLLIRRSSLLC